MKNKIKILLSIICSLVILGVGALLVIVTQKTTLKAKGDINFTYQGVNATVYKATIADVEFVENSGEKLIGFGIIPDNTSTQVADAIESWKNIELQSQTTNKIAKISFSIKNNNTIVNEYLKVTTTASKGDKSENASISIEPSYSIIDPDSSQTFFIFF